MNPPPIQWIPVFEAAARHLSFRQAADELNVSPPAVSQQIKALESYLNVSLFTRFGPRLTLTEAGEILFQSAQLLVSTYQQGFGEFDRRFNKRTLRLNAALFIAQELLIPHYAGFRAREPKADLRITTGSEYIDFQDNTADAAIRVGQGDWPNLKTEHLCDIRTAPVCAPQLFQDAWRDPTLDLSEIARDQVIISINAHLEDWLPLYPNLQPKEVLVCDSYFSAIKSAEQGLGITLGLFPVINQWINTGRLKMLQTEMKPTQSAYWLVYPHHQANNELIKSCFDWAKALFDQIPPLVQY